ncbi:MAG: VWA domain-containing protein [Pseudomonadaceae bacterium]|nr:VWA domain-containing protein [Pseudomonadaceae bacterium]
MAELADFHFLRPLWLLVTVVAVAALVVVLRRNRAGMHSPWQGVIDPELADVLLDDPEQGNRRRRSSLLIVAIALLGVALAGPAWQRLPQDVERTTDALFIVLDLSLSMYARDVAPSRLVQARHKVIDILRQRDEGYTALIAYAGDAHTVAPLTDDVATIENLLGALEPGMMPVFGSDIADALRLTRDVIERAGVKQSRIIVITDGIDRIIDVTGERSSNHPISILAVGTEGGAPIPLDFAGQPGRFLQNDAGTTIVPQLDETKLADIAELSFGRYARLSADTSDVEYLLDLPLPQPDQTETVDRQFDVWADAGFWLLIPVALLLLPTFRRGALTVVAAFVIAPSADANLWQDLWLRDDQQAFDHLRRGAPERAETLFKDPAWQGVARYRSDDFDGAAERFQTEDSARGHYNRGTALAKAERFQEALAAFDAALALEPDHADAQFNRDLVERILEESQANQSDPSQSNDEQNSEASDEESSDGEAQDSQSEQQGSSDEENADNPEDQQSTQQDQKQKDEEGNEAQLDEQETDEARSADSEASEQWLRRVPDEPGGLLRRKFQHETNQRLQRGDYASRETERIW